MGPEESRKASGRQLPVTEPPPLLLAVSSVEVSRHVGHKRWVVKVYDPDVKKARLLATAEDLRLQKLYYPNEDAALYERVKVTDGT